MEIIKVPKRIDYPDAPVEYFVCLNDGSAQAVETDPNLIAYLQFYDRDTAIEMMYRMALNPKQSHRTQMKRADFCLVKVDNERREVVERAWEGDQSAFDRFIEQRDARRRVEKRRAEARATKHRSSANPGWGDF